MPSFHLAAMVAAAAAVFATSALAADPKPIGSAGVWTAYRYEDGGKPVCYIAAKPEKSAGKYARRGEVYALITHRPAENAMNVVSIIAGYTYKPGSEVKLKVGDKNFTLFTDGDTAWARDQATDTAIANAIRSGLSMSVEGVSNRDSQTSDTFKLDGSNRALDIIGKACRETSQSQPAEKPSRERRRR
jgi:Invasion associated locus B (IalB) protein